MDIANIFYEINIRFIKEIVDGGFLLQYEIVFMIAYSIIAVASCFFGLKILKILSGYIGFLLTGIILFTCLEKVANREVVVIVAVFVGLIIGFLGYQYPLGGRLLICGFMVYNIANIFIRQHMWIRVSIAFYIAVLAVYYSVYGVIAISSIWGGLITAFNIMLYFGYQDFYINILIGICLSILGIFTQYRQYKIKIVFIP